jgi:hypothetical protein
MAGNSKELKRIWPKSINKMNRIIRIDPFANVVIASEAKQSQNWQPAEIKADCFVTSFLAKTLNRLFARASRIDAFDSNPVNPCDLLS